MKALLKLTIILALLLFFVSYFEAGAQTVTIYAPFTGTAGTGNTATFTVPSDVVAQVVYAYCPVSSVFSASITVTANGASANINVPSTGTFSNMPIIAGPAAISLASGQTFGGGIGQMAFCTIQTTSSTSFTPSTAVVIPADGGGPVTIILESSVDLVNWIGALPGTYGTTSSNRFFRVRAQR